MLLPTVLLLTGLLMQPACLLYTRSVMEATAAECARVLATGDARPESCRAFALRRLAAVPEAAPFHVGGEDDWEIGLDGAGGSSVTVTITGHARPLPLVGLLAQALAARDDVGVVMEARAQERLRASWVEGGYDAWVEVWRG